jgi:hypothetical protein
VGASRAPGPAAAADNGGENAKKKEHSMERIRWSPHPARAALLAACVAWTALPAQAQQARMKEQGAATQRQAQKTEQANRAAAVADETSDAAQAARTAQSEAAQFEAAQQRRDNAAAPLSYGPVLHPRGQQAADPARKDPAEIHDETDSQARSQQPQQQFRQQFQRQSQQSKQALAPRRPALQTEPMAPRPLRPAASAPSASVPIPAPASAPRPVVPSSSVINSCQGSYCTDAGGNGYNIGSGNAGTSSGGRLCTRTGVTVQCF